MSTATLIYLEYYTIAFTKTGEFQEKERNETAHVPT